ncbi:hypothetical protein NDU88_002863 [Pleurodeles waltl]|uniref:Uncharacterized protein n=1 Tax=Pleurodeles waltl TaxID=8319 RepID=A0AAV7UWU0_PLEWA|nr:hypothetical protein NDU88_002863 [Pleurodeles waltl]
MDVSALAWDGDTEGVWKSMLRSRLMGAGVHGLHSRQTRQVLLAPLLLRRTRRSGKPSREASFGAGARKASPGVQRCRASPRGIIRAFENIARMSVCLCCWQRGSIARAVSCQLIAGDNEARVPLRDGSCNRRIDPMFVPAVACEHQYSDLAQRVSMNKAAAAHSLPRAYKARQKSPTLGLSESETSSDTQAKKAPGEGGGVIHTWSPSY